jgi:hypothetical protein
MISTPRGVGQSASSLPDRTLSPPDVAAGLAGVAAVEGADVVEVDEEHPM